MQWIADLFREQILAQVLAYLVPLIVGTAVGWAAILYTRLTGRQLDKLNRDSIETALTNAVRWAIQQVLDGKLAANGTVPEAQKAAVVSAAKEYVKTSAPGAIKHFKMTEGKLEEKVQSKLPLPGELAKGVAK